jgi:hypothetical protein
MALTTVQRFEKRGIVAWQLEGALARLTKDQSAGNAASIAILKELVIAGAQLALTMRYRVQEEGNLGDQRFPGYGTKYRVKMSPKYASAAHLSPVPWRWPKQEDEYSQVVTRDKNMDVSQRVPTYTYKNRYEVQRTLGKPDGSYTVTGGMWRGVQARGSGSSVILDFQGSSEGAGRTVRLRTHFVSGYTADGRPMTRGGWTSARLPAKVRNNQKAYGIYDAHKIHVLKPTQTELDQMGARVVATAERWAGVRLSPY